MLWIGSCPSTNDVAWEEGRKQGMDLLCVAADAQTAGRGRHGRSWISPPGKDLLLSVYLRPPAPLAPAGVVTAIGAIAVCEAVEPLLRARSPKPEIRWPNDLYLGDRKLCGILAEGRTDGAAPDYVLGIGLNVGSSTEDWPGEIRPHATSLRLETGREQDRRALLSRILDRVEALYAAAQRGDLLHMEAEWSLRSALRGRKARILVGDGAVEGTVEEAGLASGIALRLPDGSLRRLQAEHVTRVEVPGA